MLSPAAATLPAPDVHSPTEWQPSSALLPDQKMQSTGSEPTGSPVSGAVGSKHDTQTASWAASLDKAREFLKLAPQSGLLQPNPGLNLNSSGNSPLVQKTIAEFKSAADAAAVLNVAVSMPQNLNSSSKRIQQGQ